MIFHPDACTLIRKITATLTGVAVLVPVLLANPVQADDPFELSYTETHPGVWVGVREDSPRIPVVGNSVFVVGDEGVVVFDGGAVRRSAEQLLEKMREVTDLPVTHVVVSHWHGDHNLGIGAIVDTYPLAQVVSHEFTRAAMVGSNLDYARNLERVEGYLPGMREAVETGSEDGNPVSDTTREWYRQFLEVSAIVDAEYRRSNIVIPNLTIRDKLVIYSGQRRIELLYLGDANTAGDIVMWLPEEKLVATGDIVVAPTPYGFNVPPRRWIDTLINLKELEFETLVPGHGLVQTDSAYVDLIIATADSIIEQRDALLASGLTPEEAQDQLDYSQFRERYTGGDALLEERFDGWFARPFSAAAFKALTGEPMVVVGPSELESENSAQEK